MTDQVVSQGGDVESVFAVDLPDGWFFKESITLLAPDGQANIIASSEPLNPDIDTDAYAAVQGQLLNDEFPEYIEFSFERSVVFGGLDGWVRTFEWTPPDGVPVAQMQLYAVIGGRGYTATATVPADLIDERRELLRKVILSVRRRVAT